MGVFESEALVTQHHINYQMPLIQHSDCRENVYSVGKSLGKNCGCWLDKALYKNFKATRLLNFLS